MTIDNIVSEHNILDFQSASALAFQQLMSSLKAHVDYRKCEGETAVGIKLFDQTRRTGRVPNNLDNRTPRRKRWLMYQDPVEDGEVIDETDMWKQAFDPMSDLNMSKAASIARQCDEIIIKDGFFGDAFEGKSGPSKKIAFPAGNVVAADTRDEDDTGTGEVGQNIKKMREARLRLTKSEIFQMYPGDSPKYGWSAKQHDDMLQYLKVTSLDFNRLEEPVLVSGRITKFMGFELVECERWPLKDGTTDIRLNCAWVKRAVKYGEWLAPRHRMWNLTANNNLPYINHDTVIDARRMYDEGVIQIENKE